MQKKIFVRILLIMGILSPMISEAATYYVSPTGTAPWLNCININTPCAWQTAMSNAGAGDIVNFRGGTYDLGTFSNHPSMAYIKMYPANSGTSTAPIIMQAYTGETPIVTGTVSANSQEAWFGCAMGTSNIEWDGFATTMKVNNVDPARRYETALVGLYGDSCTVKNSNFMGTNVGNWSANTSFVRVEHGTNSTIYNNYFHDLTGTTSAVNTNGIWIISTSGVNIYNNTFWHMRNGTQGKVSVSSANFYQNFIYSPSDNECQDGFYIGYQGGGTTLGFNVYKNVIIGCTRGVRLVGILGTIANSRIFNNTILNQSGRQDGIYIGAGVSGVAIYNNIISGSSVFLRYYTTSTYSLSDYNLFYNGQSDIWNLNFSTNYTSLGSWQSATRLDAGSRVGDPLFAIGTGANPDNYRLTNGSPAKEAGRNGEDLGAYTDSSMIIGYSPTNSGTLNPPPSPPQNLRIQ